MSVQPTRLKLDLSSAKSRFGSNLGCHLNQANKQRISLETHSKQLTRELSSHMKKNKVDFSKGGKFRNLKIYRHLTGFDLKGGKKTTFKTRIEHNYCQLKNKLKWVGCINTQKNVPIHHWLIWHSGQLWKIVFTK